MGNNRYVELKYEGKTYTQKYEIDEILLNNDLNWFLDAEIENARIEIMKETLIFNGGIWYNGVWEYGVIRDIDWRAGTFVNGVIYNGVFKRITVEKGIVFDGTFIRGDVLFADIRGGEFKDVNISNNVNQTQVGETEETEEFQVQEEPTQPQPQIQSQPEVQVQGEITGQEAQEIQSQVQERRIVKTYEAFLGDKNWKSTFFTVLKNLEDIEDIENSDDTRAPIVGSDEELEQAKKDIENWKKGNTGEPFPIKK